MTDASNEIIIDSKDIEVIIDKDVSLIDNNIDVKTLEPEYEITINRKEYNVVGDELYIPKRYEDAPQWLRDIIDNVTDVALSAKIIEINNLTQSLNNLIVELEVAKNTYTMSIISSNDINERINTAVETLNSSMMESDATILGVATTRVTPEQAQAISINALMTSLNDTTSGNSLGSIISGMQATTTTGDYTNAQSIEVLQSTIEGNADSTASAINKINTFAGLDKAGAYTYTGLTGYLVDPNTGMIGGGQSELQNTITTTGDNVEAKFEYGSNIKIGGQYYNAGFGLKTTMTGGGGTIADPYNSEFWINAEKFKFTNNSMSGQATPFTIDASGATPQISFNGIVNFSNITNTTGTGSNLLYNSAPKIGSETKGWYVWSNSGMTVNLSAGWNEWKPTGGASVAANIGGNPSIGSVYDVGQSSRFPVIAGSRYEASAYISAHRSNSYVLLVFYDTAGNYAGESSGNVINYAGSSALVNWGRSSVFATAPGNAATATLIIRSIVTGTDPYCFVTNAFAGVAEINQTTPSNWSEGTSAGATYTSELSNDAGFTTLGAVASQGYVLPAGVANAINNNTTTIDGSKITTGTIDALQIASDAIAGKTITGGTINGAIINGVQINGAIIKGSFIDLTSTITLTNWQFYTPATIPPAYAANFAHNNNGTLTVDSSGFVRLPGQTNFIVGQISQSGTLFNGNLSNVTTYPSAPINKIWEIYSWNEYKLNTLQRSIRNDTQFSSNSLLVFKGSISCQSPYGGSGTDVNNYGTYSLRFLNTDIVVSIQASNGNQHNAEITNVQFNGTTVAYADGRYGESTGSDSAFMDYTTTIKGISVNFKTTFTGMAGYTFIFTATISNSTRIANHTVDDVIRVNSVSHSLNTANSSVVGQTLVTYEMNFPSTWVV